MSKFLYRAKNTSGDLVSGSVVAANEIEAEDLLLKNNLILTEIEPEKGQTFFALFNRYTLKDRLMFVRQLSTMIAAGVSLPKAIGVIASQTRSEYIKDIYYRLIKEVEAGNSLSVSLAKFPRYFSPVMIAVIRAGEQTGNLETVLKQLATQLERDNYLASKFRNAMVYPTVIFTSMILVAVFMMIYIIPKFKEIFASAKADLPIMTSLLITISDSLVAYWYFYLIAGVALVLGFRAFLVTDNGQLSFDTFKLKVPVFNRIFEGLYMSKFAQTLAMMSKSGVPILESIKIISAVIDNRVYEEGLDYAATQVEKGLPLSSSIQKNPYFPVLVSQMIAVGEQTGQLETVMEKMGQYYEEETDEKIKGLAALIEPVVMIIIGIGVAFIVISIITPIYKIAQLQ